MKLFNGQETLEMERTDESVSLYFEGSQIKIKEFSAFEKEAEITVKPNEIYALALTYSLDKETESLSEKSKSRKNRIERLRLAQQFHPLTARRDDFRLPFLHPELIFFEEGQPYALYFGATGVVVPFGLDDALLLRQYKALVLSTVNPKVDYEEVLNAETSSNDKFTRAVERCETISEVEERLAEALVNEEQNVNKGKVYVKKGRHQFLIFFSVLALLALLVSGVFLYQAYQSTVPKQSAIIQAQSDFLTQNYSQTLSDLEKYSANSLPNSAKYVLANSSVQLSSLTAKQKEAVLNNLSTKTDTNTLNYWIDTGRSDFNSALNLAKNLGDNTLTYLAYYNLYESTKLNTTMSGAKKQALLDSYQKEIDSLGKTLGLNK